MKLSDIALGELGHWYDVEQLFVGYGDYTDRRIRKTIETGAVYEFELSRICEWTRVSTTEEMAFRLGAMVQHAWETRIAQMIVKRRALKNPLTRWFLPIRKFLHWHIPYWASYPDRVDYREGPKLKQTEEKVSSP